MNWENSLTSGGNANLPQESRKRGLEVVDDDSEDSFDAPVEFISIPESKRAKLASTPVSSPFKRAPVGESPLARSPKVVLTTPAKEPYVISDWDDDSPVKPATATRSILTSIQSNTQDSWSRDSFVSSVPANDEKENLSDSFDEDPSFRETTPVPVAKRAPKRKLSSGIPGFPSLSDTSIQVSLTVKEIRRENGLIDLICVDSDGQESIVYLQGQWTNTRIDEEMKIRLIGAQKWGDQDYLLSDQDGLLILEPDTLVPCTSVAGTSWCPRKVILNERFKGGDTAHKAMLIGCIMHELFQIAVQCPDTSIVNHEWLLSQWRSNLSSSVMEAFSALNFSPKAFETELIPYAEVIVSWVKSHVPSKLKEFIKTALPTGSTINDIHDIEENIWEPLIGVKGKIDASLETQSGLSQQIEALELKTGKSGLSIEHSTQVLLYCMMLSIRYDQPLSAGSLLYLKDGVNRPVAPKAAELKGILQQRNSLAYFMGQKKLEILPEPRSDPHFCGKCEQALTCSLYQAKSGPESGVTPKFASFAESTVAHLNGIERDYFTKWTEGIFNEHLAERRSRGSAVADLWNVDPDTREARGNCAAHMELSSCDQNEKCVILRFERDSPIREGLFCHGAMATISSDKKFGIALCCVTAVDEKSVSLRCERKFRLLQIGQKYHLDVYSSYSTYASTLGNVLTLMQSDPISSRHRKLIIDLEKPEFVPAAGFDLPIPASQILASANLNAGQKQAVLHALRAKEYSLIEGLPGSGKTTTIAVLIRCLVASGSSVLLTSYTNSAVDTVLSKLLKDMAPSQLLRLGRVGGSSAEVGTLSLNSKLEKFTSEHDRYTHTRKILKGTPVVACTCHHTSREVLFSWRSFDVCIVDEASMVLEPVVLSALAAAKRFVMVGDTKQLAPLVLARKSRDAGLDISLFERLQMHREAVTSLVEQFRMNRRISSLPSRLFYEKRLVCANDVVAEATLSSITSYNPPPGDLALSPELQDSVVFLDTESQKNADAVVTHRGGGVVFNEGEARLVADLVKRFRESGVPAEEIGVMCVYRRQVDVIKALVDDVEVNTVDQYQGRDKAVIIWSLVWTDSCEKKCELLNDARRVNVALTRAKYKLVIVGCEASMKKIDIMSKLISDLQNSPSS